MSLLDVIDAFGTSDGSGAGSYTVTRRAAGTTTDGWYTPGATSTLTITASVQPYQYQPLVVVPEGQRVEDVRVIYTSTQLYAQPGEPDVLTIGGVGYAVYQVQGPYEVDGDTTYVAAAARQVVPGGAP